MAFVRCSPGSTGQEGFTSLRAPVFVQEGRCRARVSGAALAYMNKGKIETALAYQMPRPSVVDDAPQPKAPRQGGGDGDGTAEDRFYNFFTLDANAVDNYDRLLNYLHSVTASAVQIMEDRCQKGSTPISIAT